ncbi:hypothetical protein RAA17_14315 [Komagataeibacter rhaeticus]|nr:hypothetical protein [Komagataeibacter rhaeticus]
MKERKESRQARRVAAAGVAMAGLRHEGAGWRVRDAARLAARRPLPVPRGIRGRGTGKGWPMGRGACRPHGSS